MKRLQRGRESATTRSRQPVCGVAGCSDAGAHGFFGDRLVDEHARVVGGGMRSTGNPAVLELLQKRRRRDDGVVFEGEGGGRDASPRQPQQIVKTGSGGRQPVGSAGHPSCASSDGG